MATFYHCSKPKGVIYVSSNSGAVCAVERQSDKLIWKHQVSNSNITSNTASWQQYNNRKYSKW